MQARPVVLEHRIDVHIATADPLSRAGIASQLHGSRDVQMVEDDRVDDHTVALVVADELDGETTRLIRSLRRRGLDRVIVILTRLDDATVLAAVEAGATGLLRRSQATPATLHAAIRSAVAGEGSLPPDLLGRLLDQVGRLQRQVLNPRGLTMAGLTDREIRVLKLLADGLDTAAVGRELFYSERTVKNIIHDLTSRLDLRNRTHAVAYAIKQGLI